jgi:hypothetical protein
MNFNNSIGQFLLLLSRKRKKNRLFLSSPFQSANKPRLSLYSTIKNAFISRSGQCNEYHKTETAITITTGSLRPALLKFLFGLALR